MRDLLVVLNPRRIDECMAALDALAVDRLWVKNMSELEIAGVWPEILGLAASYDRLIVQSDDGIVRPHALAAVQELLDDGHPVVTGYSNLSATDFRVNLTRGLLADEPSETAYDLYTLAEIMEAPNRSVETWLVGMALTGMSVEMWKRFPFEVWRGMAQSDFWLSKRLAAAGVQMVGARDAFVWHVKEVWNRGDADPRKKLLVGVEPAELVLEEVAAVYA